MMTKRDKILLAESDGRLAQAIVRELHGLGAEASVATDAMDTLVAARRERPNAIVINGQLAGGGGLTALRRLRCNVFTADIPVVVVAPPEGAEARELLAAGAQECVAPPLSVESILAAVRRHVLRPLDFTEAPAAAIAQPDRLAALQATALLDSPPEESFDRLTRLASRLLGAGTALVSLVDKDRQFFKSQTGLAQPWAGARQTRLSHSFCQWVVSGQEALVVEDATRHPVLRSNLAIRDLGVIAYAGVPISDGDGQVLGSLCAIDGKPRSWSDDDLETLYDLRQAGEAYAALARARRGERVAGAGAPANVETSIHVAGKAISCATRILRRYGARLGDAERDDLLAIIDEQGRHLTELVPELR
jgi:CheY-like chemotaxis protein